jgi:hypothetical protein
VRRLSGVGSTVANLAGDLTCPFGEGSHRQSSAERITNAMSYWLHDLRRLLGTTVMANLMRSYAQSQWYGVSTVAEFKAAAQAVTATNLTSFWSTHRI